MDEVDGECTQHTVEFECELEFDKAFVAKKIKPTLSPESCLREKCVILKLRKEGKIDQGQCISIGHSQ